MFFFLEYFVSYTRLKCSFFIDNCLIAPYGDNLSLTLVSVIQRDHIPVCLFCLPNLFSTLTFLTFFNFVIYDIWIREIFGSWDSWRDFKISTAKSSPRISVGLLNVRRDSRVILSNFLRPRSRRESRSSEPFSRVQVPNYFI